MGGGGSDDKVISENGGQYSEGHERDSKPGEAQTVGGRQGYDLLMQTPVKVQCDCGRAVRFRMVSEAGGLPLPAGEDKCRRRQESVSVAAEHISFRGMKHWPVLGWCLAPLQVEVRHPISGKNYVFPCASWLKAGKETSARKVSCQSLTRACPSRRFRPAAPSRS